MSKPHEPLKPTHRAKCPLCRHEGVGTLSELAAWTGSHLNREHPQAGSVRMKVTRL